MKAKLCVVLEDHEINLAQAKDKNANGIDEIVYVL
jgi:hypothetical protein